jgi:Zn-dependent protease with chaperone function
VLHATDERVKVDPWPSEEPLHVLAALVAVSLWAVITITIIGLVYAVILGFVFFTTHLMLIAHVRGNGVRLGPDQFPELHEMVERLSRRIGLSKAPEAYLLQQGGALNAFATRFLSADIVVLYSDLVDACGGNVAACEMIVGHELAHVKRGHLRWHWLLIPAYLVPFLGTALSRAREYTCDRYGRALAGTTEGALLGLSILAVGGKHGPRVNRASLVAQRATLNTGLMRIAEWLSTHPPLASRLVALEPSLESVPVPRARGNLRAIAVMGAEMLPFVIGGAGLALLVPMFTRAIEEQARQQQQQRLSTAEPAEPDEPDYEAPPRDIADGQVVEDFDRLIAFLKKESAAGRALPSNGRDLYRRWNQVRRYEFAPVDPFDGQQYGYETDGRAFVLWSSGPDASANTEDDIHFDSRSNSRRVGKRPALLSLK